MVFLLTDISDHSNHKMPGSVTQDMTRGNKPQSYILNDIFGDSADYNMPMGTLLTIELPITRCQVAIRQYCTLFYMKLLQHFASEIF